MAGGDTGSGSQKSEPNVVPLCDILLVLLIIFMVVTPMIQKGANVQLPEAKNVQAEPEPGQLITIYVKKEVAAPGFSCFLEGTQVKDLSKLAGMIEDKLEEMDNKEKKVLLKADIEVAYGHVVDIMNEIKNAQIEKLALITEKYTASN